MAIKNPLLTFVLLLIFQINTAQSSKPNIILIVADDQRAHTINHLGNNEIITPNLDELARNGVSFSHSYIMGSDRPAVCAPSRAMLMSGRNLFQINVDDRSHLTDEYKTLPEVLRENGYVTFGTGKQHNGKAVFGRGFAAGGKIFFKGMGDHWNVPVYRYDPTGVYDSHIPYISDPFVTNKISYLSADHIEEGKHSTELFTDAAIDFLENKKTDQPFFLYLSYMAPHDPRSVPQKYLDMYNINTIRIPPNYLPGHPFDNGELYIRDEMLEKFPRLKYNIKVHIRDYYAMITHIDEQIGKVMKQLEKQNLHKNTIIIYTGDNGLALGQHGLMGKQNLYEHSIKVPLIFYGKNIPKDQIRTPFIYLYDLFPTICEMSGTEIPSSVQGESLIPVIDGKKEQVRDHMYFAYRHYQRAIRNQQYKLIEYVVDGKRHTQLFDLINDPWEQNNLARDINYEEIIQKLKQKLADQGNLLGDSLYSNNEFWKGF